MSLSQYNVPSRSEKILPIIGIVFMLLAIYGIVRFVSWRSPKKETEQLTLSLVEDPFENEYYKDSDNDGAYDWEEALFIELDPNNPDSDGDGVLDGEYIKQKKRNEAASLYGETGDTSSLSESEQLGRSLYTALLAAGGDGSDGITENIADYINDLSFGSKTYLREDLPLVQNTYANAQAYTKKMNTIFNQYEMDTEDIAVIMQEVEHSGGQSLELHSLNAKYQRYLTALLEVPVLHSIAGRHTELVNSVSQFSGALENLVAEEPDDLVSLSFLVQLEQMIYDMNFTILDIKTFMDFSADPALF